MANKPFDISSDITLPELMNPADIPLPKDTAVYDPKNDMPKDPTKPGAIPLPLPGAGQPPGPSPLDRLNTFLDTSSQKAIDPAVQTKSRMYGADMDHHKFERFYNMPRVYNKLGFTPFRDNEAAYNKESGFFDEIGRASGQWATLAGLGLKDAVTFGDLTDTETARKFERAMDIGSSSKGGATGFVNNLYLNSGYTFGIIGEAFVEEVGLGLITAATLGSTAEVTLPTMMARGLSAFNKVTEGYKAGKNVIKTLDALKDANKARQYFKQAAANAGNFINPLQNTVDFMQGIDNVQDLGKLATATKGFADFYRDVRNVRLAWGEAGLEGGMVRNTLEKELLQEHLDTHNGQAPTEEEAMAIKETALTAGATTGWQNVGAIYFSNKIVFDNFKPFSKVFKGGLTDDILDAGIHGKIRVNKALKENAFSHIEKNLKNTLSELKNPRTYGKTALTYFKANLAEGLQETAQEVIGGAATDYYKNEWRGTPLKGGYYSAITDNLHKQASAQGIETFMSGFLMGGMVGPVMSVPSYIKENYTKYTKPEEFAKEKQRKEEYINKTVNQLNELWNNIGDALVTDLDNLSVQDEYKKGMDEAVKNGDSKTYHDLKNDSYFEHIDTALRLGRFDTFIERLQSEKNLSEADVQEAHGMSQAEYFGIIDKAVDRANHIQKRYTGMQTKFKNPFNPSKFKPGTNQWVREASNFTGWAEAQKKATFMQYSFDRNLERMTSIMGEAQKDAELGKVAQHEFNVLFQTATMDSELALLNNEVQSLAGSKGESLKLLKSKQRKQKLLTDFNEKMKVMLDTTIVDGKRGSLNMDNKETKRAAGVAKTAYKNYLKYLADVNKDYSFDAPLDNSFVKLIDYHMLNDETKALNKHINTILDPYAFTKVAEKDAAMDKARRANQQKEFRDSLEAFVKAKETNDLMQLLYDVGVFLNADDLEALTTNGIFPKTIYHVPKTDTEDILPVLQTSPEFEKASAIIRDFVPNIMDIPIVGSESTPYDVRPRAKFDNDKRTYADLAIQYGFDAKAASSKVPLPRILEAIIDSEYATDDEKALAEELLTKAKADEFVTFVNDSASPGAYSYKRQSVVDARYSSANYRGGTLPIEHVILHEEIHRRTMDALDNDVEFKEQIDKMLELTQAHFDKYKDNKALPPYGLSDAHEFVAEAMSNSRFQELLAEIPYENTTGTVWTKFVDSVLAALKKVFGKDVSNTVLNEVLNVVSAKIDLNFTQQNSTESIPQASIEPTADNVKLTKKVDLANHPELASKLVQAYKEFNVARIADGNDATDPSFAEKSDEQILKSIQFKTFFKTSTKAQEILDQYNADMGRVVEAPVIEPVASGDTKIMSTAMRNELIRLGYKPADYNITQAQAIIDKGLSITEAAELESAATILREAVVTEGKAILRDEIDKLISSAKTIEELDIVQEAIANMLDDTVEGTGRTGWDSSGYNASDLDALILAKKNELAFSFEFEDIYPGMTVIMKNNEKLVIDEIADDVIYGHKANDITKLRKIKKADVKNKIKYIFKADIMNDDVSISTEDVSVKAEELSEETQKITAESINNPEATADAVKAAKEGGETGWLDNVNEC